MSESHAATSSQGRGLFIVFEGLDGAGTTTQAGLLAKRLEAEGRRVHLTAEPSTGPIGKQIRAILEGRLPAGPQPVQRGWLRSILEGRRAGGKEIAWDRRALALLFAADRLDHWSSEIDPLLSEGVSVICDRYVLSSLAYQGIDCPPFWLQSLNRFVHPPDRTIFLRVPPEVALGRRLQAGTKAELFETLPLQQQISILYEEAVERLQQRHRIIVLDGERTQEDVARAVWNVVAQIQGRR